MAKLVIEQKDRNRWIVWSDSDLLHEEEQALRLAGFIEITWMGGEELTSFGEPDYALLPLPYRIINR